MEQKIAADLIRKGISKGREQRWADLGSGDGVFTMALAGLLKAGSVIHAIDKDKRKLESLLTVPNSRIEKIFGDFTNENVVPSSLDGIVLANSLHYVADQALLLKMLFKKLNEHGRMIIVEYDMDRPNPWVPYPLSFRSLEKLIPSLGLAAPEKTGSVPSHLNASDIYSALILK